MPLYSVSLTTNSTTFSTTIEAPVGEEDYQIAMLAVRRINEDEGFDLSLHRWDYTIEQLGDN